jgi:hypothetical protein
MLFLKFHHFLKMLLILMKNVAFKLYITIFIKLEVLKFFNLTQIIGIYNYKVKNKILFLGYCWFSYYLFHTFIHSFIYSRIKCRKKKKLKVVI